MNKLVAKFAVEILKRHIERLPAVGKLSHLIPWGKIQVNLAEDLEAVALKILGDDPTLSPSNDDKQEIVPPPTPGKP